MRQAIRVGMTLREVCTVVTPFSPMPGACLVGRGCKGLADVISVEETPAGHSVTRYRGGKVDTAPLKGIADLEAVMVEMASTCSMIKVGYGYYDVHL